MPHVDEGTLHALLDGALLAEEPDRAAQVEAHLRSCPDCRALLDEAAGVRADAAGILAAAAPAAPPTADFADVRARSAGRTDAVGGGKRRSGSRRRGAARPLHWTRRVAWAASLVLALGTGYLLRDMAGPASSFETSATAEAGRTPVADPASSRALEMESAAPTAAPPPPVAGSPEIQERARERDEPEPRGMAQGSVAAAERARQQEPVEIEEIEEIQATDATASTRDALASAPAKVRAEPLLQLRSQTPVMSRSADGERAPGEAWLSATLDEARAALDGPVYRLPRARIEETYVDAGPDAPRVLTLQRLESGVPVRVVQALGSAGALGAAPPASAAAGDGSGALPAPEVARVTVDRYTLEVTGSLPVELLAILAQSASPAR